MSRCRILFSVLLLVIALGNFQSAAAQNGNRGRAWIECDPDGEARIWFFVDDYGWPEVLVYSSLSGPKGEWHSGEDLHPKHVNPHVNKKVDYVEYRITARFYDGHFEEHQLIYRWPSGCSPTRPTNSPTPKVMSPTIDYAGTAQAIANATAAQAIQEINATAAAARGTEAAKATVTAEAVQNANATATVARATLDADTTATTLASQNAIATSTAHATATATATAIASASATTGAIPPSPPPSSENNLGVLMVLGVFGLAISASALFYVVRRRTPTKMLTPPGVQITPPKTLPVGAWVDGNYKIKKHIGTGGQARVYLAEDMGLGGKLVALKQCVGTDRRQSQAEAILLANLSHPNLPRVTRYFVEPDGTQYLVMDYVEGENLYEIVKDKGALTESAALAYLRPILQAVKYLHYNRIIHRDIKPENIIITPQGNAVLVDFGIAKTLVAGGITPPSIRMGTEGYAPTEQYSGGTTERSDIYALGATLYFILTRHVPTKSTDRAAGANLIPPRQLKPNLTPRTETAILTAVNLVASQRYGSVKDLEQALY